MTWIETLTQQATWVLGFVIALVGWFLIASSFVALGNYIMRRRRERLERKVYVDQESGEKDSSDPKWIFKRLG